MEKIRKYFHSQLSAFSKGVNITLLSKKTTGYLILVWFGFSLLALPLSLIVNRQAEPKRHLIKKNAATRPAREHSQPQAIKTQNTSQTQNISQTWRTTTAPAVKTAPILPVPINKQPVRVEPPKPNPVVVKDVVKPQPKNETVSPYQFQMLARIISAEAKGEPFHGQVAVGAVILNRIASGRFPKTIAANVLKRGQFEPVANGSIWNEPVASAYRAASLALKGWDPTGGALYFFNPAKTSSRWIWSRPIVTRIGDHVFAV